MLHSCRLCNRVLKLATRDSFCLKCLYGLERSEFDDNEPTRPGIVPSSLMLTRPQA